MRAFVIAAAVLLGLASQVLAEPVDNGSYETLLRELKVGTVDGSALRNAWAESSYYDPYYYNTPEFKRFTESIGESIPKDVDGDVGPAQEICANIPPEFFVDMRIHIICVNLAQATGNSRSVALHENVIDELLDSIGRSGDGLTAETAYQVVSAVEAWEYLRGTGDWIVDFGRSPKTEAAFALTARDEAGRQRTVWFARHTRFAEAFNAKKELALRQLMGIGN